MSTSAVLVALLSMLHASTSLSTTTTTTTTRNKTYEVVNVNCSCTPEEIRMRIELSRNFRGVVYAKGFPLEKSCRGLGTDDKTVDLSITTSGCGVRLVAVSEDMLAFTVVLSIQTDKFLQQINDLEITSTCNISPNDMVHTKHSFGKQLSRTGRYRSGEEAAPDSGRRIRSWMEIEGTSGRAGGGGASNKVSVGEQTLVLVKSILPGDMTANVVDCYAHDGTREVTQRLLDEFGCPLDESIMPSLEALKDEEEEEEEEVVVEGNEIAWEAGEETMSAAGARARKASTSDVEAESRTRMHVIGTMFSAFKFPDTSNLHLKCVLQICRRRCPTVSCDAAAASVNERTSKSLESRDLSSVVDRIEVFNSVEVVAPGIDNDGYASPRDFDESRSFAGDKTFCLSASKMAFSFAILGAVFLCGVLAALWTIMRNQMRKMKKSYDGSEQVLVVRDSPLNLVHARNKAFANWSYT